MALRDVVQFCRPSPTAGAVRRDLSPPPDPAQRTCFGEVLLATRRQSTVHNSPKPHCEEGQKVCGCCPSSRNSVFIPFPPSTPVIKFWYILEGKVIPFPSPCCLQATHRHMDVQKLESTSKQTQNQHLAHPGNSKSQNHQPLESAQLSHWCELPTQFWDTPCLEHTPSPVLPLL